MSKHTAELEQERRMKVEHGWWKDLNGLHNDPKSFYWKYAQYLEHSGIRSKNRMLLQYMALQSNRYTMCPLEDFYKIKLSKYPEKLCIGAFAGINIHLVMGDLVLHECAREDYFLESGCDCNNIVEIIDCGQTIKIGDLKWLISDLLDVTNGSRK